MHKRILIFFMALLLTKVIISQPTWVDQTISPVPPFLSSVSTISKNVCWIGGANGTVLYTSNGGFNWAYRNLPPAYSIYIVNVIAGIDSVTALCTVTNEVGTFIFRSTNQGSNWNIVYQKPAPAYIDDIKLINSNLGFAVGDPINSRWHLLRIMNGGTFFDTTGLFLLENGIEYAPFNSMFISGNSIWFGTNNHHIYHSTNLGTNWTFYTTAFAFMNTITVSGTTGFAGGDQTYKSTDGGNTWPFITLPGNGLCNAFVNNNGIFWYTKGNRIFVSTDGGVSFAIQHTSPGIGTYTHMSFVFNTYENTNSTVTGWGITDDGIVSKYQQGNIGITPISNEIPENYLISQNYPNPFNPTTSIKFALPKSANVRLVVYDILGNDVATLIDETLKPGSYEVVWNSTNNSSGIYFYKLTTEEFTCT